MTTPVVLYVIALLVRLAALALWPFDGLYGQDAYDYYRYAVLLRDGLSQGQGAPPFFWPIGYPLHIVAGSLAVGMRPLAGQIVSILAGALVAPLTFALAREALWPVDAPRARRAGVVAGLTVAVAGQLMISSLSIMSDAVGLAWATASALFTLRTASTRRPADLLLAAGTWSMATITRWIFGLLVLPWALCVLIAWRRNWRSIDMRRAVALTLLAGAIAGLIVGPLLFGGAHTGDLQVVGWDPANAFRREVVNTDGTWQYPMPTGLFYLQPLVVPGYVFPLLVPLWLIGLGALGRVRSSARVLLIGWPLAVYVFLAGIAWQNPRFALALFPPLAVWVGLGFDLVWERRPTLRRWLVGLTAAALVGGLLWSARVVGNFVQSKNADLARVQHVVERVSSGARVFTFGITLALQHYSDLDVIELYHETPESLPSRLCGVRGSYVYVDVANLERQWRGLPPEVNYHWLRDEAGLIEVDRFEGFTLFRVVDVAVHPCP